VSTNIPVAPSPDRPPAPAGAAGPPPRSAGRGRPAWVEALTAPVSSRTWVAQIHVVLDFVVGLAVFLPLTISAGVGGALACTIVLIPVLVWLLLAATRLLGIIERGRYQATLGVRIPDPYPAFTGPFLDRAWQRLRCAAAWKELLYAIVLFPLALIGFTATTAIWSVSLAFAALPLYLGALPNGVAHLGWFDVTGGASLLAVTAVGLAGIFVAPWVARGWVAIDVFVARNLLGRGVTYELEERVDVLQETRSWALDVAEAERRRIERDLHDGAQQRLVALAMELGMAREKLDDDPESARALIEHAHSEAKAAIVELRDLARGIHPPDLGGTGLPGAIPVLAGRCAIPVTVEVSVPERPAPSVEGIAYFVVSEALANVAKHAGAARASVRVAQPDGWLVVEVADDGRGGATAEGPGSGLRGLSERVRSVDGRFSVSSPAGGPTIIRAELPCAS
jgi:signal transduction histidine kinase